jgi:threonine aldolase
MQHFASDNYAGICPEALHALIAANNSGHEPAYGDDSWTNQVCDRLRELFQTDCEVFFVFNGTAANSLALASLCQSYHSVICHELAHIETDECGGPEFFSGGSKLLTAPGIGGKLTPDAIEAVVTRRADIHYPKPKVVTLTQSTEVGECGRRARCASVRDHLARGRRRTVFRWHQERLAGGRSGGVLRPRARCRLRLPSEAGGPACFQDALHFCAVARPAR